MENYLKCKVAAWEKKTKKGNNYYSLKIEVTPEVLEEMYKNQKYVLNANIFLVPSDGRKPNFKTIDEDQTQNQSQSQDIPF